MRVSVAAKNIEFNSKGYITQTFKELRHQFLLASQAFIESVAPESPKKRPWLPFSIPIDTGMARGSFLNLLQLLIANKLDPAVYIPTTPQRKRKIKRWMKPLPYFHTTGKGLPPKLKAKRSKTELNEHGVGSIDKTPRHGQALATTRGAILQRVKDKFVFTYESNVKQINIHDPDNWLSFERGRLLFAARIRRFKPPQVKKYIVRTNVSGGRQFGGDSFSSVQNRTVK